MTLPRPFDLFGALSVLAWMAIIIAFSAQSRLGQMKAERARAAQGEEIRVIEGSSWMVLMRDTHEVGYIRESRTRVDEAWLMEYEMMMLVEIGDIKQLIETTTRATLDERGALQGFQADLDSFVGAFTVKGEVSPEAIDLELMLGARPITRRVALDQPPRLAQTALNRLVADPARLKVGERYESEYFDPMSQQMSAMTYTYIEHREVELYETMHEAYHFEQELMGEQFDVYVNPEGEILIQEFPMRTAASKLPNELGKTRISAIAKRLRREHGRAPEEKDPADDELAERARDEISPQSLGLQGALKRLGDLLATPTDPPQRPENALSPSASERDLARPEDMTAP